MTRATRRMKQEPVVDHSGDLLPTPPQSSHTSHHPDFTPVNMPLRAGSQPLSVRGASTVPLDMSTTATTNGDNDGDTEMAEPSSDTQEALQVLADQPRQLIRVIQKLETLNIKSTLPSLPMFVVIGDQSAGKSSIIEAACDITLPRNEGTCTRCPFKITTTASKNNEPWQCKISLHLEYAYVPNKRAVHGTTTFDHWVEQELTARDFVMVYSKADLDLALRRAQLAILNPQKDLRTFVNMPIEAQEHRVGFSPNVINLEIMAPDLPEMSFYDLPGAINTLPDESQQYLVNFVELLIKKYIRNEKAYILLACAATNDLETSTASKFLTDCHARTRCMGIYTKLDMVDMSTTRIAKIRKLLLGAEHRVGDGWFMTRQLSQKEIDERQISHADARKIEATFFTGHPWTTELAEHAQRFGIPNLSTAISRKLTQHILNDLPTIARRVQDRLDVVEKELSSFPEPEGLPYHILVTEITNIKIAIDNEINADRSTGTFRKEYRELFRALAKKLQGLKPFVTVSTPGYQKASISLSSDEEESPTKSIRTNSNGRAMTMTPSQSTQKRVRRAPQKQSSEGATNRDNRIVFRLDEVKLRFDSASSADIPGQISESVVRDLIREALSGWGSNPEGLIRDVRRMFEGMIDNTISQALPKYQNTEFLRQSKDIAWQLLDELNKEITNVVIGLVAAETHRPITYNTALLTKTRTEHEHNLRKRRNETRTDEYYDDLEAEGRKVPSKPDQKKKAADSEFIKSILGDDEYEREVKALATPLAYYEIVSAQLVDSIAKQIELGLMAAFESRLQRKLQMDLRIGDQDHCAELLAEDPETERRRVQLVAEKGRLMEALAELNSLPAIHGSRGHD